MTATELKRLRARLFRATHSHFDEIYPTALLGEDGRGELVSKSFEIAPGYSQMSVAFYCPRRKKIHCRYGHGLN